LRKKKKKWRPCMYWFELKSCKTW